MGNRHGVCGGGAAQHCVDECTRNLELEGRSRDADGPDCDPAGAVFNETLEDLPPLDQEALRFAGTSNLSAIRWLLAMGNACCACLQTMRQSSRCLFASPPSKGRCGSISLRLPQFMQRRTCTVLSPPASGCSRVQRFARWSCCSASRLRSCRSGMSWSSLRCLEVHHPVGPYDVELPSRRSKRSSIAQRSCWRRCTSTSVRCLVGSRWRGDGAADVVEAQQPRPAPVVNLLDL
eukprot:TRINITY_DN8720_c0_g1_i9.p1 TRINITY_DN8720_c0_g1~~TRINITY_DN8720_c0_g1_i9.p1  ORF type:complete len:234 (-),score=24.93 TRINITY_DN8720_c0_g1_i9:94-795(-)